MSFKLVRQCSDGLKKTQINFIINSIDDKITHYFDDKNLDIMYHFNR